MASSATKSTSQIPASLALYWSDIHGRIYGRMVENVRNPGVTQRKFSHLSIVVSYRLVPFKEPRPCHWSVLYNIDYIWNLSLIFKEFPYWW